MKLFAHCIGLSKEDLEKLNIKTTASLRLVTQNGLTQIKATGIYDDLLEIVSIITSFNTFEIRLF